MRTRWIASFIAPWALLAAGCSVEHGGDPWATGPSSMSSAADDDSTGGSASAGDDSADDDVPSEDTSGANEATGADEAASAGTDTAAEAETTGADEGNDEGTTTGDDETTDATSGGALDCLDLGACQPCVDCTVAPAGPCQAEALACQNDADCNVLANCYNGCAMQFMGDELMTCVQGCYDAHPDSVATFQAAYGCFLDVCGELCG